MALLEVDELVLHYGSHRDVGKRAPKVVRAVDGISFSVSSGEMFGLVGESGCGKSTTAEAVLRLLEAKSGVVRFAGVDIAKLARREMRSYRRGMQIVYQDPYESLDPRCRVAQVIEEPLRVHGLGATSPARRELVKEVLSRVELNPPERYLDRYPHELSGGQRQRVAIAAAIVLRPKLLVADEPVSMLDVSVRAGVMSLLKRLCTDDEMAILMITHDLAVVARFADRIAVMYLGRIVEVGDAKEVLRDPRHPYTRALCEATPRRDGWREANAREILGGEPPNAASVPDGCRFHPRCFMAEEQCRVRDPRLKLLAGSESGHEAACLLLE